VKIRRFFSVATRRKGESNRINFRSQQTTRRDVMQLSSESENKSLKLLELRGNLLEQSRKVLLTCVIE
jgi:hypothetical protein